MEIEQINSMLEVKPGIWNSLIQNHDPFLRHEFLSALEQSGAVSEETGWRPYHLLVSQQKKLVAAMPLYLKSHSRGEYVFDQQWADAYYQSGMEYYPKWVNSIPFTPCYGQRILIKPGVDSQAVIKQCIDYIKHLSELNNISSLHCLFPTHVQAEELQQHMLIRSGLQYQWFNRNYRDFDDYLQTFTSRQRKKINKERRLVKEQGISFQRLSGLEISEQQWWEFFRFYEMTYLKKGQHAYLNFEFFKRLAESLPEQICLVMAVKKNSYVGAALSFVGADTLYGRYWGCYEEYNSLHFETCYYQGLEYCLEQHKLRFDSGAQGEHKISRGFEPVTTYSAHWIQNSQFSTLISNFLASEKRLIQQYKEDCSRLLPFKTG